MYRINLNQNVYYINNYIFWLHRQKKNRKNTQKKAGTTASHGGSKFPKHRPLREEVILQQGWHE